MTRTEERELIIATLYSAQGARTVGDAADVLMPAVYHISREMCAEAIRGLAENRDPIPARLLIELADELEKTNA